MLKWNVCTNIAYMVYINKLFANQFYVCSHKLPIPTYTRYDKLSKLFLNKSSAGSDECPKMSIVYKKAD